MKNVFYKYYPIATGLVVFLIYLSTLAPAVTPFDSGELATVQATLGIAHPTGYPLFTITGYLFSLIPLPLTTIVKLNILSAIWCSLAIIVLIYTAKLIATNLKWFGSSKFLTDSEPTRFEIIFSSIITGLALAFSVVFWYQSNHVEVYALQTFITNGILYFSLKAYLAKNENISSLNKYWIFTAVLIGLGFSNHMMTSFLLPGIAFLFFDKYKLNRVSINKLLKLSFFVLLVSLLLYSYLFIRANQNPTMNWGNTNTFSNLLAHVSGKYYESYFLAGIDVFGKQLWNFLTNLFFNSSQAKVFGGEYNISIFLVLTGIVIAFKNHIKLFIYLGLIALTTLVVSSNYDIPDIYEYFLNIFIIFSHFALIAIINLLQMFRKNKFYFLAVIIITLIILTQFLTNYKKVDSSDYYIIEDYVTGMLNSFEDSSIYINNYWDVVESPSYYYQKVENIRKDVKVIDFNLLLQYWYYKELKLKNYIIIDSTSNTLSIENLKKGNTLYLSEGFIRDFYSEANFKLQEDEEIVPDLYAFKVVPRGIYSPAPETNFKLRIPKRIGVLEEYLIRRVYLMLKNRMRYELKYGKEEEALKYYQIIIKNIPQYRDSIRSPILQNYN